MQVLKKLLIVLHCSTPEQYRSFWMYVRGFSRASRTGMNDSRDEKRQPLEHPGGKYKATVPNEPSPRDADKKFVGRCGARMKRRRIRYRPRHRAANELNRMWLSAQKNETAAENIGIEIRIAWQVCLQSGGTKHIRAAS
jgi:hypothetical protein